MAASRKKIILSIIAVFFLTIVFVAAFSFYRLSDVDEIKKIVVANLEEALGRKVRVGEARIDFGKGVGLRLKNVSIGGEFQGRPKLSAQTLWVVVKLFPLIEKRVEFRKIVVQGASVLIVRDARGQSNIGGFKDWTEKPVSESSVLNFFKVSHVDKVVVEGSSVQFIDQYAGTEATPNRVTLENLQVSIRKDLLTRSFKFSLKGEFPHFDKKSTINISGKIGDADFKNINSGFSLDGKIKVEELNISSFRPYIKKLLGDTPDSGRVSVDSIFSGQIGGTLTSSGRVRYTSRSPERQSVIRDPAVAGRGTLDYKVSLDGDRLKVDEFHLKSGPFESQGQGTVQPFLDKDPQVSLLLHTNDFQVDKSQSYLPLNIFPKEYHDLVHQRIHGGTLQVQTLKFEGLWTQLKNITLKKNHQRLSGTFKINRMDWKEPLPHLKQVTGIIKLANGDQTVDIAKANYYGHPLNNIHGTIKNVIDEPVVDVSLENQVELGTLHDALLKIFSDSPIKHYIQDYKEIQGPGIMRLHLQGPLMEPEQLALAAELQMQGVSLFEKDLDYQIKGLDGTIYCFLIPDNELADVSKKITLLRFDQLKGHFGESSFTNLSGKIGLDKGVPVKKMEATYQLNSSELPKIVKGLSLDEPFNTLGQKMTFHRGGVKVAYHSVENPEVPESIRSWGTIDLKDLSMKYRDKYQPFQNLTGAIEFKAAGIQIKNIQGWYGDSAMQLQGAVSFPVGAETRYNLHLTSAAFKRSDFKGIPFLQKLELSGAPKVDLRLNGSEKKFSFQNQIDLTDTAYQYANTFSKLKGAPNSLKLRGNFSKTKGLVFGSIEYGLGGNKVTGSGQIKSFRDPSYSIHFKADDFLAHPAAQFIVPLKYSEAGTMSFDIRGSGNLNRMQDSTFDGTLKLKNLAIRLENYSNTLVLNSTLKFSGDVIDITDGQLTSDLTHAGFQGKYNFKADDKVDLEFKGDRIVIDELLPEAENKSPDFKTFMSQSPFFPAATGRVRFDLKHLNFKLLKLDNVSGIFTLEKEKFKIDTLDIGKEKEIRVRGLISINENNEEVIRGLVQAKNTKVERFLGLFGDIFDNSLTGDLKNLDLRFQSKGKGMPKLEDTIEAKIVFDLASGKMNVEKLKKGTFKLFNVKSFDGSAETSPEKDESLFAQITGKFTLLKGVAKTEDFIFETVDRRTSLVGKFDLRQHQIDAVAGVAPLAALDKFLTKIPLVGKIITGGDEKSLMKSYYTVKGKFSDPEISAIPFTSLTKKVVGIFQGILQTPQSLFPEVSEEPAN